MRKSRHNFRIMRNRLNDRCEANDTGIVTELPKPVLSVSHPIVVITTNGCL